MNTIKKWWQKVTTKVKSVKDRFIAVISGRINRAPKRFLVVRTVASAVFSGIAAVLIYTTGTGQLARIVTAMTIPAAITSVLAAAPPALLAVLKVVLASWAVYMVMVPLMKVSSYIFAPEMYEDMPGLVDALLYPFTIANGAATIAFAAAALLAAVLGFVGSVIRRFEWLSRLFLETPRMLIKTRSLEGFQHDFRDWKSSWKWNHMVMATNPASTAEAKFEDLGKDAQQPSSSASTKPTPKKTQPTPRQKKHRPNMRVVTPSPNPGAA